MFFYICILLATSLSFLYGTPIKPTPSKTPPSIPLTYAFDYEAATVFQAISFPLSDIKDPFTTEIFTEIDANFGHKGLNLNHDQINLIKKTYLYLIFLVKLEAVQKTDSKFKQYRSDFAPYLKDNNSPQPHIPDKTLVTSAGWNNVLITTQDIANSSMWQLFCKASVTDTYSFFYTALNIIHEVEQQTFNYIPHIETSFYDHDYTNLRSINELTRLKIILETTCKDYYVTQCSDWNALPTINPNQKKQNKLQTLEKELLLFKQIPFYKNTHDIHELLGIKKDDNQTIATKSLLSPKQLASPLKEQAWCYFMLNEMLSMLYGLITPDRLSDVLTYCSQNNLSPSVFPYTIDDYVYFEELLSIKSKTENTHTKSVHPSPPTHKKEDSHVPIALHHALHSAKDKLNKNAKVQWFWNTIAHAVESAAEDIKHAAVSVGDAIEDAAEAAAHGVVGVAEGVFGATVGFIGNLTDVSSIKEFGSEVQKEALDNLQKSTADMEKSVNELATGVKDALAAGASIDGALVGIITDDKKLGQDFQTVLNSVEDSLVDVGAKFVNAQLQYVGDINMMTMQVTEEFSNLVASSVGALYTGDLSAIGQNAEDLLNDTIKSITSSFSNLLSASKELVGAVMQGLGAIMNSLTTIFIDISREVTFLVTAAANLEDTVLSGKFDFSGALHNAKEARNSVTNTLEAHRQTINQVMGVAIAIGFTIVTEVASGGAATGADAAIDAELISGDIVASAVETGTEAATEVGTETATEGAVETGTETTTEASTQTTEDVASQTEKAGEDAAPKEQEPDEEPEQAKEEPKEQAKEEAKEEPKEQPKEEAKGKTKWEIAKQGLGYTLKALGNIMNIVFSVFGVLSGINGDAMNESKEKQQEEQLINMWKYINDNKIAIVQNQSSYLNELQQKQQATLGNQILALTFIKNLTYANINSFTQQISHVLAQQLTPLLTPNNNGMLAANIGTSWGIETNYLDLYPTQGFSTASTGRTDFPFAQEVAQAPYAANDLAKSSTTKIKNKKEPIKLWFNQKVTAMDETDDKNNNKKPLDPLQVEIDLQVIYITNGPFYTGLYLGGNHHDYTSSDYLDTLTKTKTFDLDAAHLAKMVILFRDSATDPLHVGVYEHEGKNWITKETLPATMQLYAHHTYHMKTNLDKDQLTIKVFVDSDSKNIWSKTVPVTALENQRTYGVIASGVAVQWNQTSPKPIINVNTQARPPFSKIPEIEREKKSKQLAARAEKPTFGSMKLQAVSKQATLFGQYLYATQDTNLKKVSPKNSHDFVVFAINRNQVISNIGIPPNNNQDNESENPNVIVSVITGNVYDEKGNIVSHSGNLWNIYQKQFGPFDTTISSYITTVQTNIFASLSKITFGSFDLDAASQDIIQKGLFIYTCDQTLFATDATGKKITDYLIFAQINNNELGDNIGMPPTANNAQGLISLVTGNLYAKTTTITKGSAPTPIAQGYNELYAYENQFGTIDQQLLSKIQAAQTDYQAYLVAQKQSQSETKTPKIIVFSSNPTDTTNLASPNKPVSLGSGPIHISLGTPSKGSLSDLQKQAAGPAGFQLKLGTPPHLKS